MQQEQDSGDFRLRLQESVFYIFGQLAHSKWKMLVPHVKSFHDVFYQGLKSSPSFEVRIAALSAVINFIPRLSPKNKKLYQRGLWKVIMRTLKCATAGNEASVRKTFDLLIKLARTEPRFLMKRQAWRFMLQIAEAGTEVGAGSRYLAIEFLITSVEAMKRYPRRRTLRKFPFFSDLFSILMKMLLDIEDVPEWHTADTEDEDAQESRNYSFGKECLNRLAIASGEITYSCAKKHLPAYLAAREWEKRHAALIALAQISEGCSKTMRKDFLLVCFALEHLRDPHSRVRWAAFNALGQFCTHLGPDLLDWYDERVLPPLAEAMDDFQNPRVQAHAASVVLRFSDNCTPGLQTTFLKIVVEKLLVLLQNGKQMVQEESLKALTSVAASFQEQFDLYYDEVMPHLKAILVNKKSNRMLRAIAMDCISRVGMAVENDKFRDDAKQVMVVFKSLQGSQPETDDPTTSYMLQACLILLPCLGQDFLPYMSVVMPPTLLSAQLDDESMETITLGDKRIGIKSSVLEEKASACILLGCYAEELKEGFYPWIDKVAPTLVPLLEFYLRKEVREAAVLAMPRLLRSAKLALEKGLASGGNESYLKKLSECIIPALVEALRKEPDTEICAVMFSALNECFQISGSILDESQVRSIVDVITKFITVVVTASSSRKKAKAGRVDRARKELDLRQRHLDQLEELPQITKYLMASKVVGRAREEYLMAQELLKKENEQDEIVFDQAGKLLWTLIETFKASSLPFFDKLSSYPPLLICWQDRPQQKTEELQGGLQFEFSKEFSLRLVCPALNIGGVIGSGGSKINKIRQTSGATIEVEHSYCNDGIISISAEEVFTDTFSPTIEAALLLQPSCSTKVKRRSFTTHLLVPTSRIGCLIGEGGSIIAEMRNTTNANIHILSKEDVPKVACEDDEMVQISGDRDVAKDALLQVTLRLRGNLFGA